MNNSSPPLPSDSQKESKSQDSTNSGLEALAPSTGDQFPSSPLVTVAGRDQVLEEHSPGKMVTRTVEVGKWKIWTEKGYRVENVWLKGMRGRLWPLKKLEKEEFHNLIRRVPNGYAVDEVVMRGLPSLWYSESSVACIWPAPNHQWEMVFEIYKA